jgi:sugar fermentation stimulation protein A
MLRFSAPLQRAQLKKRYKRFFVDASLDNGEIVTAHCPNTGSMESCYEPDATIWLSPSLNPTRKLKWTWELAETNAGFIGVNTSLPNLVVEDAIQQSRIPELHQYDSIRREVKYGANSRIDLLLEGNNGSKCYVEVKNTTLIRGDVILFPDAVTERGRKHLTELANMVEEGHRAIMLFFVNRSEGRFFKVADAIDAKYGQELRRVAKVGVELLAYRAHHSLEGISLGEPVAIDLT